MTIYKLLICFVLLLAGSFQVKADETAVKSSPQTLMQSMANSLSSFRGTIAPAVSFDNLPYREAETKATPTLLVMGRLGRMFFEGNRFGYVGHRSQYGAISLVGQVRSHQYFPKAEEKAFEAGVQHSMRLGLGWFSQVSLFTDLSDTHQGQELELSTYRRDSFGELTVLTLLALQQQSRKLTGYYANSSDYQIAQGDLNTEVEFIATYPLTDDLRLVGIYRHYFHGAGLTDSPLTSSAQTQRFILGIGWAF